MHSTTLKSLLESLGGLRVQQVRTHANKTTARRSGAILRREKFRHYCAVPVTPATIKYAETQRKLFADLTAKVAAGFGQRVELNLRTVKVLLAESNVAVRQFILVRQPQELFALLSAKAEQSAQKVLECTRHVVHIAAMTRAELTIVPSHNSNGGRATNSAAKSSPVEQTPFAKFGLAGVFARHQRRPRFQSACSRR